MLKILDRYILRAFFTNYLIALAVLIGLYVTLDLFINLDEFTGIQSESRWRTVYKVLDFYGHNLFLYFAQLTGIVILLAACFTLGRLQRTNELTAVLACGTSLYRVAAPVLLAALGMNALWFVDQEFVIPGIADKLSRKHADIEGRHSFAVWFQPDRFNAIVSAAMFHPRMREMRGVLIMQRDEQSRMTRVIRADRATWDEERQVWHLVGGVLMDFVGDGHAPGAADMSGRSVDQYASDLTPKELALQQASLWVSFLSLPELNKLQQRFAESGAGEFIKAKHRRLTAILVHMVLLCLGIPYFLDRERTPVVVAGARCLALCGACYVFTFVCNSVDLSALLPSPALPPWLPLLIFLPVAVVKLDAIRT